MAATPLGPVVPQWAAADSSGPPDHTRMHAHTHTHTHTVALDKGQL